MQTTTWCHSLRHAANRVASRFSSSAHVMACLTLAALLPAAAHGATIFSEDFDDSNASTRWTTVTSGSSTLADYAFDYSAVTDFNSVSIGVPQTGQTTHTGLKLAANFTSPTGAIAGVNSYANSLNLTTSAVMTFDMYAHFTDTGGSTIYGTYGFYHSTQTGTFNSLGPTATSGYWFTNSSDNGTSTAMRALEVGTQDNTAARYLDSTQNPGSGAGVTYQALFPDLDAGGGNSLAGYVLNRWVNVRLTRDMSTGLIKWEMKKPTDANYTTIYSFNDPTQTQNTGTITLGMTDPFASLSGPNTYYLYDNVVVSDLVPEPSCFVLLSLAAGMLLACRRKM